MIGDFIGGGQVFLHKVRMFRQVLFGSFNLSIFVAVIITMTFYCNDFSKLDASAIVTYRKAVIADALGDVVSGFRVLGGKNRSNNIKIDAKTKNGIYIRNAIPTMVMKSRIFKFEDEKFQLLLRNMLSTFCVTILSSFLLIFLIWSKFG
nr:hypothetical protein [Rickettsiaceae bacterium]